MHWNLLRITTANAIMWCDIFHFFIGRNKNRKPIMKGNFWLNINIEGHISDLHCLFRYFKNIWPFRLTLVLLNKDIFLPSCCREQKNLVLSEKRHLFHWWHSLSCLVKSLLYHYELYFPAIAIWYLSSTIMTMKAPVPQEYKVSVRLFLKFTIIFQKDIFEKYYRKPISTYFDSELKGMKLK